MPDYVVGFVDGEGSFSVTVDKRGQTCISFNISNTDRFILEQIRDFFAFGKVMELSDKRLHPNWSKAYRFYVTNVADYLRLVDFFDRHAPIVKKTDYEIFRKAVFERRDRIQNKLHNRIDVEKLKVLYQKGLNYKEIARTLNLKVGQVNYLLWKYSNGRKRRTHHWTAEEKKKALNLFQDGYTYREIAEKFGVSVSSVIHMLYSFRPNYPKVNISERTKRGWRRKKDLMLALGDVEATL